MRHTTSVPLVSLAIAASLGAVLALSGCSGGGSADPGGKIAAVGAENEYADVISQLGGQYVSVTAIMSNPNTDPHTFEASPQVAAEVSAAQLVVQNGVGYDDFMNKIESASPSSGRNVIVAQTVLGLPDGTANPHLWYDPKTMPAVAKAITDTLDTLQPSHKAYFDQNLTTFDASLKPWTAAIASFKTKHPNVSVATTEPVADYLLTAAGITNKTPWNLQAAIMNGTDPAPQDAATQEALLRDKTVDLFVYNQQVTDSITDAYLAIAAKTKLPVVGVYETMPTGYTYQKWMEAELNAIEQAVENGRSTAKL